MYSKDKFKLGSERSAIRELFEYGKRQARIVGAENVFDFSLGNPSVPAPKKVNATIKKLLKKYSSTELHGYTSAQGSIELRTAISNDLNSRFDANSTPDEFYISCGAAAALCSVFGALRTSSKTEIIAFAPYFPEYKVFVEGSGAKFKTCELDEKDFQFNFEALEKLINENTAGVIVNSPNNPSGVVYSKESLEKLSAFLEKKSKEFGHPIYIISDEPYRELVYDNIEVPFVPSIYANTIVCYSYSKSLSLPGERIGYVYVPGVCEDSKEIYAAVAGSARSLGYVCAPSLLQRVVTECVSEKPDLSVYDKNRRLLYEGLSQMGYSCVHPDGAFYLLVKSPKGDGNEFSNIAKEKNILVVSGESFGCKDYVRISYCVDTKVIQRALPYFKELIK
ncbi:MAG: pyridoxal phosphate-dependent aminotransferase [Clostridia bacterium]|nr:pyridoxal phosphate-dependent aminotransferase [Clostridia bacterium]